MSASTQTDDRMDLTAAIQISLRAFGWGIVGLLPVVGLLPAFYALACWLRVQREFGKQWNPGARYLIAGAIFATLGILGSIGLVVAIIANANRVASTTLF